MIWLQNTTPLRRLMMLGHLAGGIKTDEVTTFGNPITFLTDLAKPLKSLEIPFSPRQTGSGDPSPTNVRNIVPWNGLTVWNGGKNLLQNTASSKEVNGVTFTVNSDGTVSVSGTATGYADLTIGKSEVPNKGKIVLSGLEETVKIRWSQIRIFDADDNVLGDFYGQSTTRPYVINMDDYPTAKYIQIGIKREDNNVAVSGTVKPMLEVGETATAYEPYHPITDTDISFPSPVYGGTLDAVTGVLTVGWARVQISDLDWQYQENWSGRFRAGLAGKDGVDASVSANLMCDCYKSALGTNSNDNIICGYGKGNSGIVYIKDSRFTDKDDFVEAVGDYYIYYPLLTPQEIQLTPQQITAIVGNNTLWSDANHGMTAVYLKKK